MPVEEHTQYTFALPEAVSFTATGLEGYRFGPLRQKDVDVYYIESDKGHDTFMVSKKITRTYYVLSGNGYFTIDDRRYDVCAGVLAEIPPRVEYSYSGKMTLLAFARPGWFSSNDKHTKWNPEVTCRPASCLPGGESWVTRLLQSRILGRSPAGVFLALNKRLWRRLPTRMLRRGVVRSYGNCVHAVARTQRGRAPAFSGGFLRNRPELELIRRLLERRNRGQTLRVAVLGCSRSIGPEAYSLNWIVRSARPELNVILTAVTISPHAVEFASRGVYPLSSADWFERMTAGEKNEFFDINGQFASVRSWLKEAIGWHVGDPGEPDIVDALGPQDMVVASSFLSDTSGVDAERCLRNIVRLVRPDGHLFVSGIDLDVRTSVARELGWKPIEELLEEIHEGDSRSREHWPWHYGGLEPLDKQRRDWRTRYAAAFQLLPTPTVPSPAGNEAAAQTVVSVKPATAMPAH